MPTYEYRCAEGHLFEQFQRMSEPPVKACPTCGAEAERLLSAGAGLLFKGSGFYITDYRSDSYKKAAQSDSSSGESKGSSSGESKGASSPSSGSESKGSSEGKSKGGSETKGSA
jgi:putative FmdB family regulatory protein